MPSKFFPELPAVLLKAYKEMCDNCHKM